MSLINDYSYQIMTDQRERDLARLAERNRRVRLALSGRVSFWQRLRARREQRIHRRARFRQNHYLRAAGAHPLYHADRRHDPVLRDRALHRLPPSF